MPEDKIEIENINTPGRTNGSIEQNMMRCATRCLRSCLSEAPGLTVADAKEALLPHLPDILFPQGKTAGWWLKAVQLDLEAKGVIKRAPRKPVHLYRQGPV